MKTEQSTQANINTTRFRREEREESRDMDRQDRFVARSRRSHADQLRLLDKRLGADVGAVRERKRLKKLILGEK